MPAKATGSRGQSDVAPGRQGERADHRAFTVAPSAMKSSVGMRTLFRKSESTLQIYPRHGRTHLSPVVTQSLRGTKHIIKLTHHSPAFPRSELSYCSHLRVDMIPVLCEFGTVAITPKGKGNGFSGFNERKPFCDLLCCLPGVAGGHRRLPPHLTPRGTGSAETPGLW